MVWFGEADRTEQTQAGCSCATRPTLPRTRLSRAALSITHTTHNSHLEGDETTIRQTASPPILHRTVAGPTNCSGLAVPSPQKFSYNKEGLSLSLSIHSLSTTATVAASTLQNAATPKTEHKQIPIIITVNKNKNKNKHRTQNTEHRTHPIQCPGNNPQSVSLSCCLYVAARFPVCASMCEVALPPTHVMSHLQECQPQATPKPKTPYLPHGKRQNHRSSCSCPRLAPLLRQSTHSTQSRQNVAQKKNGFFFVSF